MFSRVLALLAVLLLSANTWAAIEINNHQARNMDDVQSLGVIYINHNFATESEARQALNEETDAQGATYYHVILMREPGVTAICTPARIFIASTRYNQRNIAIVCFAPFAGGFFLKNGCGIRPVISRGRKFPQRVFYFCP